VENKSVENKKVFIASTGRGQKTDRHAPAHLHE
jgi:hypothetical protein